MAQWEDEGAVTAWGRWWWCRPLISWGLGWAGQRSRGNNAAFLRSWVIRGALRLKRDS
jgi:hypothetical protein